MKSMALWLLLGGLSVPACGDDRGDADGDADSDSDADADTDADADADTDADADADADTDADADADGDADSDADADADADSDADSDADADGDGDPAWNDITVSGTGFEEHDGQDVYLAYEDGEGFTERGGPVSIEAGEFTHTWPDAFDPDLFGVNIAFFVDQDDDGECDADHAWRVFLSNDFQPDDDPLVAVVGDDHATVDGATCADAF